MDTVLRAMVCRVTISHEVSSSWLRIKGADLTTSGLAGWNTYDRPPVLVRTGSTSNSFRHELTGIPELIASTLSDAGVNFSSNETMCSRLASCFPDCRFSIGHVEPDSMLDTDLDGRFAGCVIDLFGGQTEESEEFDPAETEAWEQTTETAMGTGRRSAT